MMNSKLAKFLLWALMVIGFIGSAKVSYANMTGAPCPNIASVPICYIVLLAYVLMIVSMLIPNLLSKHYLFCSGWSVAFLIALVGSAAEVMAGGGVCPSSGGGSIRGATGGTIGSVPMCFISLSMLVAILILFLLGPYKRACELQNV